MKNKFITDVLPINYSIPRPISDLERKKKWGGLEYTLLGQSEKNYSFAERSWHGIRALAKTVLTLGLGIFLSQKIRSDWKSFFIGKKVIAIYSSSDFLQKKISADQGDALAQCYVGFMYEKGFGVAKSDQNAVKYHELAADQDHTLSQIYLGYLYMEGRLGVQQSDKEALNYYRLAANQKHPLAQFNLGWMYAEGRGVSQSYSEAAKHYLLAANQGNAQAQDNLRSMYEQGLGGPAIK